MLSLIESLKSAVGYAIVLFVFFPGVIFVLGLASGMAWSLITALETLYYVVVFVGVVVKAFGLLDRLLSR